MNTRRCLVPLFAGMLTLLSFPAFSEVTASGYDRMDGDYIRPNRRPTPKRNFNTTLSEGDRLNVYSVKRGPRTRVETNTGSSRTVKSGAERILDQQNEAYEADVNRVDPNTSLGGRYSKEEASEALENAPDGSLETKEAEDVSEAETSAQPAVERIDPETTLVFCSKSLLEYHWDRNCEMLKNVNPTPLTLLSARNSRYVECTVCGGKRGAR